MTVTQITPAYPPAVSGVGDYSAVLEQGLSASGVTVETLIPPNSGQPFGVVRQLEAKTSTALSTALSDTQTVFLHFSGYGYARWGLCLWLIEGLTQWKTAAPGRRLVTLFHEVYATGPIWRASFWSEQPQRHIARSLARLSDVRFVSSQGGMQQLTDLCHELNFLLLPIFSTVGELETILPLSERRPAAVVFGGRPQRTSVYENPLVHARVTPLFNALHITEVLDIGPEAEVPEQLAGRPIRKLGKIPAQEVSDRLGSARIGLIAYPPHVLEKSSIAAACFAHGLLLVNTDSSSAPPSGLEPGRQYSSLEAFSHSPELLQAIAYAGHGWYQPHRAGDAFKRIAAACQEPLGTVL